MNGSTSAPWPADATGGQGWRFTVLLLIGALATTAAIIIGNGDLTVAVAPAIVALVLWLLIVLPLRVPLLALVFLCLGLDATEDGPWDSPLAPLGRLLLHNLTKTLHKPGYSIQLFALAFLFLLLVHAYRRLSGSRVDPLSHLAFARPISVAMGFSLFVVFLQVAVGAARGGDVQMAKNQVQYFVMTLLLAYLLAAALRGSRDYNVLGRLVVAAACSKALIAIWVYLEILPTMTPRPELATTHGDSMLFTTATILVLSRFYEQPNRRNAFVCVSLVPILIWAMVANNRRLAWVELLAAILALYVVGRRTRLKRFITHSILVAIPLLIVYVGAGWNSEARVFGPVKMFRSVGDGQVDGSTLYRDLENFNLIQTLKENPIIGSGFGHPYKLVVIMPDISFFKEWRFMPHNSVLGLWAFTGWLGFTCLSVAAVVAVYFAARSYQAARAPDDRTAAFTALAAILIYWVQCWGDIGFSERTGIFLVGPAIAVAGQLAVSTGAWIPLRRVRE